MLQTLLIAFREGLEALLIVAIAALYLRRMGREHQLGALRAGVVTALVLSAALGIVLARVGALSPAWEGVMAWIAAVTVIGCTVHMMKMGRHMRQEVGDQLARSGEGQGFAGWMAVFAFAVFMVGREGVETATMIAALASSQDMAHLALGGLAGFLLAAAIAWLWTKRGNRINLGRFFQVTALFMVMFAIQLLILGFHEFTEAALVPGIDNAWWHQATEDLSEGLLGQAITILMVAVPSIWLVGSFWNDHMVRLKSDGSAN